MFNITKVKATINRLRNTDVLTNELATIVGKSPQWIRQLTRDGILKQSLRGKYLLGETVQTYIDHASGGKEEDNKPRLVDHKTEHERVKTELAQLNLERMRGGLHTLEDVKALMNGMIDVIRQRVLSISNKMAPELIGINDVNTIKSRLTKEIHEALTELSNYDPELFMDGSRQSEVMK